MSLAASSPARRRSPPAAPSAAGRRTAVDGAAALRHACALASLGPHPWGSPRARAAAAYVASQLRAAGLDRRAPRGVRGQGRPRRQRRRRAARERARPRGGRRASRHRARRAGRLRRRRRGRRADRGGAGDGPAAATAAHDRVRLLGRRGGVVDRARHDHRLARPPARPGRRRPATSSPPSSSRCAAGAGGTPVLHPIAYADPLRPGPPGGGAGVARPRPPWPARAMPARPWAWATRGSPGCTSRRCARSASGSTATTCRSSRPECPAIFASDSSFTAFYPWYHQAGDTAERLDAAALAPHGRGRARRGGRGGARTPAARSRRPIGSPCSDAWRHGGLLLLAGLVALAPGLVARAGTAAGAACSPASPCPRSSPC